MENIILIVASALLILILASRTPGSIKGHWQTFLDGVQISTQEFYDAIEAGLAERQITHVNITERSFLERHIFSARRVYLRITQDEYVFYICAAPYGTGTFVSSWLIIKSEMFINRIPVFSKLAGKDRNNKTYYQMDTEGMFRLAVHATVTGAIDGLTQAKGVRGLSELERQFK